VEARAELATDAPRVFELPRDPKDEPYINLAIAARARYLVTRDKNLLDLKDDEALRRLARALTILDPAAFLQDLALERHRGGASEEAPGREH